MPENIILEDLEIYQLAMEIGEAAWVVVDKWNSFPKKTIGEQLVEARRFNCG